VPWSLVIQSYENEKNQFKKEDELVLSVEIFPKKEKQLNPYSTFLGHAHQTIYRILGISNK